jgi:hypothetical protein
VDKSHVPDAPDECAHPQFMAGSRARMFIFSLPLLLVFELSARFSFRFSSSARKPNRMSRQA